MSVKMAAAKEAPRASNRLARVITGKLEKPVRVVIFGGDGIGKSTFAAHAPSPIFVGAEDGTAQLDVARMPDVSSWRDVLDALHELDSEHGYQSVIVDSADWLEPMIWDAICAAESKRSIEDFGYGKGYSKALDEWRRLTRALDRLRDRRRMNAIIIAHAHIRTFKNPQGDDFDRWELKLHQKAGGLLKEWCDAVLFANYETLTHKSGDRVKGISTGARLLYTERTAAWDAKNRYDLPPEIPLDWDAFFAATQAHAPAPANSIEASIYGLLEGMPEDVAKRVRDAAKNAGGDAAELKRIEDKLRGLKSIETKDRITKEVNHA
jgi:hypothetical protein